MMLKVIIDFDGTLTAEETQARPLAEKSLDTLANEILMVPRPQLAADYEATRARLLAAPHRYWWEVNGLIASYCDEGAFILNTTAMQVMLGGDPDYARACAASFPEAEYDPVVDCTNYLFHRHTAELPPAFRPAARDVLLSLLNHALPVCLRDVQILGESPGKLAVCKPVSVWESLGQIQTPVPLPRWHGV